MKEPMSNPCIAWVEKLAAIHPDDLSSDERIELDVHVAQCPACAAVRAEYRLIDDLILAFPSHSSLPDLLLPRLAIPESRDCDNDY